MFENKLRTIVRNAIYYNSLNLSKINNYNSFDDIYKVLSISNVKEYPKECLETVMNEINNKILYIDDEKYLLEVDYEFYRNEYYETLKTNDDLDKYIDTLENRIKNLEININKLKNVTNPLNNETN